MDYKFQRNRVDKISREKIIEELKKMAEYFKYIGFTRHDFDKISSISHSTVEREFGTWKKAMHFLADYLKIKNIELKQKNRGYFSDKELFDEMERIWNLLGHRPSKDEWKVLKPKISYGTYCRYFKGWRNACLRFIEYKMGSNFANDEEVLDVDIKENSQESKKNEQSIYKLRKNRAISLRTRYEVLLRDNLTCRICGRSRMKCSDLELHVDHIIPFSKGGKSTIDNLQTLCKDCNIGKSDRNVIQL